jgi:hypothetical protein
MGFFIGSASRVAFSLIPLNSGWFLVFFLTQLWFYQQIKRERNVAISPGSYRLGRKTLPAENPASSLLAHLPCSPY